MIPAEAPASSSRAQTLTFLFTDLEGSTRLLQHLGDRYGEVLARHLSILRSAVAVHGGVDFGSEGDALFAYFTTAREAVAAAVEAQRALNDHPWPPGVAVRVRMGLHTGEATLSPDGFVGLDVHRTARVTAVGHGGQVLLSRSTVNLLSDQLPEGVGLRDVGEHRLKDLTRPEHIYQLVIPGLPSDFPPLRSLDAVPNNLPLQLTTFVGRERELREAEELLARSRLLTLTGPGGTGKTRLSLQLAAESTDRFADGTFFVPLASVFDPQVVPSAIVQAVGLQEAGSVPPRERLLEHLGQRAVLLVLDNFEQLLEAAPLVSEILQAAPQVKVVVTSRSPLQVSGEQEYAVPPLGVPDPRCLPPLESLSQYEAVELFIERATAVDPGFRVTNENAPAVAEIVYRLDGLPLAIELAAARVRLLPPQAILARLEKRLTLLSGGSRDLPRRQQTLRDAIAWSHDLLDEAGCRLFARLAVFVGGFALEEAEAVCGPADELGREVFDGLAELAGHSLLRRVEHRGEARFVMLETIREFAWERLEEAGEAEEMRRRHALAYLSLAEAAGPCLLAGEQRFWLDRLEAEHDNLRAALAWATAEEQAETALRLAGSLWRFWQMRGYILEGRERLERALALGGGESTRARSRALEGAGGLAYWQGELEAARPFYEGALEIERGLGDPTGVANALYNLSFASGLFTEESGSEAKGYLEEALRIYQEHGDLAGEAKVLWALSDTFYFAGDMDQARHHLERSLRTFRDVSDVFHVGWTLYMLGKLEVTTGDFQTARTHLRESLPMFHDAGDVSGVAFHLDAFAELAMSEGDAQRALRLAAAAAALGKKTGATLFEVAAELQGRARPGDVSLSDEETERIWREGQGMTVEEAVTYALADSG